METISSTGNPIKNDLPNLRMYECDICLTRFDEKNHLRQHIGHRHLPKTQKCPDCDVMVNDISIVSHQQIHRKKHICEKCGRLFQRAKQLQVHMEKTCKAPDAFKDDTELSEKKYKCMMCTYRGPTERALGRHVRSVHHSKTMEKTKTCEICNKQFNKFAYASHKRSHGRIQCTKCLKWLSTGSGFFKVHMMKHEREEKEEEENTDSKIQFKKALGPDGFYRCYGEGCTYQTHIKRLFVRHWEGQHGPKTLKCDYPGCERKNMSVTQLWRHKKSHKRKDCQSCGKVFNDLNELNQHFNSNSCKKLETRSEKRETIPGKQQHTCELCGLTLNSKTSLRNHLSSCEKNSTSNKIPSESTVKINSKQEKEFKVVDIKTPCKHCGELCHLNELEAHLQTCEKYLSISKSTEIILKTEPEPEIETNFENEPGILVKLEPEVELREEIEIKEEPLDEDELVENKINETPDGDPLSDASRRDESENETFKCEMCDFETDEKKNLKRHMRKDHNSNGTECSEPENKVTEAHSINFIRAFDDIPIESRINSEDHKRHPRKAKESSPVKESENEEFNCDKCNYTTTKKKNLQAHISTMHDPQPVDCPECGKKVSKVRYKKHLRTHTLEFSCCVCAKRFSNRWNLKEHIRKNHPDRTDLISEINSQSKVVKQESIREKPPVMQCAHCEYATADKRNFINHYSRIHALTRCTCNYCGQSISEVDFKRHIAVHENPQKAAIYMCEKCSRAFSQKRSLDVHMLTCTGEIFINTHQFKCDICPFGTSNKRSLRNHYKMVHAPKDRQCPICSKMFRKAKLASHISWHKNRLTCSLCGKSNFASKYHLTVHILSMHPGNEQLLSDQGLLKEKKAPVHEVAEIPNVQCPQCSKMVKQSRMSVHLQIHNKQFKCTFEGCEKLFANKYALKVHLNRCKNRVKEEIYETSN
uniref:CSON009349 protein n=1 Tax=Culicoides sonorensis TaxID=179676 RepID=A0A336MC41_CULSO